MAENTTIARPYAEAIFALADGTGTLPGWSAVLATLAEVASHADTRPLIGNPRVAASHLVELFMAAVREGDSGEVRSFVKILAENQRLPVLPELRDMFEALKNEREGTIDAHIATAFALDAAQLADLVADLERRFRRRIRAHATVEPDLIGGVRVVVGDEVIDGSVRGKLAAMAAALVD